MVVAIGWLNSVHFPEEESVSYQYSDYPSQARRLADAGASLLEAIADPAMDRGLIMVELEAAARGTSARDLRLRFQPAAATPVSAPPSPEDVLSGILLELQSANALMAAGLAMNEHGRGAQSQFLNDTVSEVRSTSLELGPHIARLQFAPQVEPSTTLEKALKLFRNSADRALAGC